NKEIPEEMPNELEGSGDNSEEGMLNELESSDENNSEGGGEEEILNIFDDNEGNLWDDEEDTSEILTEDVSQQLKNLKTEFELKYRQIPAIKYNRKCTVYEYLMKTEINNVKKIV
ncbi:11817_t:CDS:2, partial [Funneliformis geosporum]